MKTFRKPTDPPPDRVPDPPTENPDPGTPTPKP